MDPNQIQGRVLLNEGLVNQQVLQQAYAALPNHPNKDLCQLLVEHGVLSDQLAQQTRQHCLSISGSSGVFAPLATAQSGVLHNAQTRVDSGRLPSYQRTHVQEDLSQSSQINMAGSSDAPQVIGDYKIIRELGRGGMGAVYLAYSNKLHKEVALKTMLREAGNIDLEGLERFQIECQTMARFDHPNIVKVYDYGEHEGNPYLVMESIQGQSLKDLIHDRGHLEGKEAAALTLKLAKALQYAHQRFVLHRDIKPENVLIRAVDQEPILMDFGLAKELEDSKEGLTVTGQFLGTPAYMPPEQAAGLNERIEKRSDIYSLGVTLYEMISGRRPFQEPNLPNLILAIMKEAAPAPSSFVPSIDRDLDVICLKCLEKEPFDRYLGARALAEDLQRYIDNDTILAAPPSQAERFRRWRARYSTQLKVGAISVFLTALVLAIPATASFRAKLESGRRYDQLRDSLLNRVRSQNEKWQSELADLGESINPLKKGEQDNQSKQVLNWHQALEKIRLDSHRARSQTTEFLKQINEKGDFLTELQRDMLLKEALTKLNAKKIEVEATTLSALLAQKTEDSKRAEQERFRLLRIDPEGTLAAKSLLELGQSLLEQKHDRQSIAILSRLMNNKQHPEILMDARETLAEALFREGRSSEAAGVLHHESVDPKQLSARGRELRALSAQLSGHLSVKKTPHLQLIHNAERVPYFVGLSRSNDEVTLSLYEAKLVGSRLKYQSLSESNIKGRIVHQRLLSYQGARLWVLSIESEGAVHIEVYRLKKGKLLEIARSNPFQEGRSYSAVAIGDFNGNKAFDFILSDRSSKKILYDAGQANQAVVPAPDIDRGWGNTNLIADLDFDGRDEIVFGEGVWQSWECTLIPGHEGQKPQGAQSQLVGTIVSMDLGGTKDVPEVLFSAARSYGEDVAVRFGLDLSPGLPDAIWSMQYKDKKLKLKQLVALPFADRNALEIVQVRSLSPLTKSAGDFYYIQRNFPKNQNTLIFRQNGQSIEMRKFLHSAILLDVDRDGDLELVVDRRESTVIYGLQSFAKDQERFTKKSVPFLEEQLNLAAQLIQEGDGFRASILLDILRGDEEIPSALRPTIDLLYVDALIQLERLRQARSLCHKVASRSLTARLAALQKAADIAVRQDRYSEAAKDLRELKKLSTLSSTQRIHYQRRLQQYESLANATPVVSLNAKTLREKWTQAVVQSPLSVRLDSTIQLTGASKKRSFIRIPLQYNGKSFRIKGTLKIPHLGFGANVFLGLVQKTAEKNPGIFRIHYICQGSGDDMTWKRQCRVDQPKWLLGFDVDQFKPSETLRFEVIYEAESRLVRSKMTLGSRTWEQHGSRLRPLSAGDYALEINAGLSKDYREKTRFDITVSKLTLVAEPGVFSARPQPSSLLGQAHFAFVKGDYEAARRGYQVVLRESKSDDDKAESCFYLALSLLRDRQVQNATQAFKQLRQVDPGRFDRLWRAEISNLSDEAREMIAQTLFPGSRAEDHLGRIDELLRTRRNDLDLLALYSAAAKYPASIQQLSGFVLYLQHNYQRSERLLGALPQTPYKEAALYRGLIAYQRGQFARALELWQDIEKWPGSARNQFYSKYVRARCLLAKSKKNGS